MITTYAIPVTTTGADGSGAGSATSELILGELVDVYLEYHVSAPATTDVTIAFATRGGSLLAVANGNTSGLFHPRASLVTSASAAIADGHAPFQLCDRVTVSVAQSNALAPAVTAYLRVKRA